MRPQRKWTGRDWILGLRERKVSEMICRFLSCMTGWLVVSITDKGSSQRGVIHVLHLINYIYKTWYFWQAIQWWRTLGRILASWSLQSIRGDITEQLCINVKLQLWVVEQRRYTDVKSNELPFVREVVMSLLEEVTFVWRSEEWTVVNLRWTHVLICPGESWFRPEVLPAIFSNIAPFTFKSILISSHITWLPWVQQSRQTGLWV